MELNSEIINQAVRAFTSLPGIGKKTALRLVLHLLQQSEDEVKGFIDSVERIKTDLKICVQCHNISEKELCEICVNPARLAARICVVENLRDLIAIESTGQFSGKYHVLGGVINPIEGIGPEELKIEELIHRVQLANEEVELIMALNPTMEGDTTIFYISKKLEGLPVKITTIARGIAFGGDLEYVDEFTLARSLETRLPYENYLIKK